MKQIRGTHLAVLGLLVVSAGLGLLLGFYAIPTFTHWQKVPCTVTSGNQYQCTKTVCQHSGKTQVCQQQSYTCCSVGVMLQLTPPEPWTVKHRGSCPSVGQVKTCAFASNDKRETLTLDYTTVSVTAIVAVILYGIFWLVCCIVSVAYLASQCKKQQHTENNNWTGA
jgi:hypothetical protein